MKWLGQVFAIATMCLGGALQAECPCNGSQPMEAAHQVYLRDIQPEHIEMFRAGLIGPVVIICEEGDTLPLNLFVTGDTFVVEGDSGLQMRFVSTLYLRADENGFLFSKDGEFWCPPLCFFTGKVDLGLVPLEGQVAGSMSANLNQRQCCQ